MELWDEEMRADVHGVGIFTLPEMELPFGEMEPLIDEIERVAYESHRPRQVPGDARRRALDHAAAGRRPPPRKYPGLSVLQIDAHADLRDSYMGTRHNHACAMRRTLEYARVTQVGIRSLSTEEAERMPRLNTTIFYDVDMREDPEWIDRVVDVARARRLHHHRRGRPGPGDHAGDRHARAGRPVVDGDHAAAPRRPPSSGASSPATSSSSARSPAWWRPTFCARS